MKKIWFFLVYAIVVSGLASAIDISVKDQTAILANSEVFNDIQASPLAFDSLDDIRGGYEPMEIDPIRIDTTIPGVGDITIIITEAEVRRYPNNDHTYETVRYVVYRHFRGIDRAPMD